MNNGELYYVSVLAQLHGTLSYKWFGKMIGQII